MSDKQHWDDLYAHKGPEQVSWYRPHLERSLEYIEGAGLGRDAAIIDVGGGTSTLVDDLLARGHTNVTVLDISSIAIEADRARLGARAAAVTWLVADVTEVALPEHAYDFWHDRAVFHFIVDADARARYVRNVRRALKPGGHIVLASFGPDGPERCSGRDVVRYSPEGLHAALGAGFTMVGSAREVHRTPSGVEQPFVYCYCRMG